MKTVLIIVYILVALVLTVLTLVQSNDDEGASSAITGGSGSFYDKNKGNTREGKMKRATIILATSFVILAIALGIWY